MVNGLSLAGLQDNQLFNTGVYTMSLLSFRAYTSINTVTDRKACIAITKVKTQHYLIVLGCEFKVYKSSSDTVHNYSEESIYQSV